MHTIVVVVISAYLLTLLTSGFSNCQIIAIGGVENSSRRLNHEQHLKPAQLLHNYCILKVGLE